MGTPEGFIIDPDGSSPLNLGNSGSLRLAALTVPPAPKRPEWASNGDSDGQALVRNPLHDNRACTMQVRVSAASMDAAMTALGTLQGKLQEACIQGANDGPGLKFNWTPSGATHTLAGFMVFAEITDLPVTYDDGWFANQPVVTVSFQCKPFLYGAEVTGPTASGTTPLLTVEVDSVTGDVPAEARLVVTDGTAQPRRWVEWGLEQEYYNAASPAPLFVASGSLVTSGFAGAGSALTGAFGGSVIATSLFSQSVAVCGTGSLGHIGSYRVKARVWSASTNEVWAFSWQEGDADFTANDPVQPIAGSAFNELDFGVVTIAPAQAGTQSWSGRVQAYTTTTGGEVGAVDWLTLFPVNEGYGRLEASYSYQPGVVTAHDEFTGTTAGSVLNGHIAPTGGTWATSGATTDFTFKDDLPDTGDENIGRSTSGDSDYRYAILGATTRTNVEVGASIWTQQTISTDQAVIVRWTDSSNYLRLRASWLTVGAQRQPYLYLEMVVAGVTTILDQVSVPSSSDIWRQLRLIAFSSGRALGWLLDVNGGIQAQLAALQTTLATGGTLATGKVGISDRNTTGVTINRYCDNFYAATPAAETLVINSGKSIEVRSDSNLRQSADGSTYGDVTARGSRLFIPAAGDAGRKARIAVRAAREDPVTMASRNDGDTTELSVFYTPRFLAVPRA